MGRRTRTVVAALAALLVAGAATGGWLWAQRGPSTQVVTAGCDTTRYPPPAASSTTTSIPPPTTTTTAAPGTTTSTTAPPATSTSTTVPGSLAPGANGPAVLALQQRLVALGYWLGEPDGRYGASTQHAVVAFQKAHGMGRDGIAGPATLQALAGASRETPRSTTGHVIEVDLARQLVLVADDGRVDWALDACTGLVAGSTPTGHFRVFRQVDGYDRSPLGVLYRPKYFSNGVAIHGYPVVPPYPASHGCVRVTNQAMDWLWSSGAIPIGTEVWVY